MKQSAAWVTGLRNKYRSDSFFRSEFDVILLQAIFAFVVIVLVSVYFNYLYREISSAILTGLQAKIMGKAAYGDEILGAALDIKNKSFLAFSSIAILVTLVFSFVIARVALKPARTSLLAQKRFIGDIAHELRTPLSVIKTNSEVTLLDSAMDKNIRKVVESNIEELDRASQIINNLLSLNAMLRPDKMNFASIDMSLIIEKAIKKIEELARHKKVTINSHLSGSHIVWGNSTALEQIALNILKNAVSYTEEGGSVTVSLEHDLYRNTIFLVKDTGVGISRKDLAHIFEPFFRAERSRNRERGSSGLGLTIVSELVKLHQGRITIQSIPRRGTTAMIVFPFNKNALNENERDFHNEISIDFSQART